MHLEIFDTDDFPEARRIDAMRAVASSIWVVGESHDHRPSYRARCTSAIVGEVAFVDTEESSGRSFSRPITKLARDGKDFYLVETCVFGKIEYTLGYVGLAEEDALVVSNLAHPQERRCLTPWRTVALFVPRHVLAPKLHTPDNFGCVHLPNRQPLTRIARNALVGFSEILPQIDADQAAAVVEPIVDLIATALNGVVEDPGQRRAIDWATGMRVRRYIESNLSDPVLSPTSIQNALRISKSTLYRAFADGGGVSHYIKNRRLDRALHRLSGTSRETCTEVCYDIGFSSPSMFSRAFKTRFGFSPREARVRRSSRARGAALSEAGSGSRIVAIFTSL